MKFLFWADRESDKLSPLIESAASQGIVPEPIGRGLVVSDWAHSLFKQRALFESTAGLEDDEIVCATDGFDVFYQQGVEYVRERFLAHGCDVVFSAERGYSHQYRRFKGFYDDGAGPSPYKYLNAGCVVGYAGALRRLYRPGALLRMRQSLLRRRSVRKVLSLLTRAFQGADPPTVTESADPVSYLRWFECTDQAYMGRQVARGRPDVSIALDRDGTLFWCTAFEWEDIDDHYQLVHGKIRNRHTGNTPACIHVPWESRYRQVFVKLYESVRRNTECGEFHHRA